MKKLPLALAVTALLSTPFVAQADTILYGSARVSVDYTDLDNSDTDGYWDVVDNDSRLGVQGSEDLGGGLSAVYQYEFGVDVTEGSSGGFKSNRPKFVGLKGNFGTVTVGTQETPYYQIAGITDIFNSSVTFGDTAWLGGSFNGYKFGFTTAVGNRGVTTLTRLDNSILYTTPEFSGFSAAVMLSISNDFTVNSANGEALIANDADGWSDGVDIWNVNVKYNNGPFFAGVSYIALNGSSDTYTNVDLDRDQWVVGLGYASGPFNVGFIYEQGTYNLWGLFEPFYRQQGFKTDDPWNAYVTASYTFGNNTISAAYGQMDVGLSGIDNMENYVLGYQYNLSKRTRLWVEYIGLSAEDTYGDADVISIGTRVDF